MRERTLKIALAASLAGNLFLVGLIAGTRLLGEHKREQGAPSRSGGRFAAVVERLDPADAEALREVMRQEGEQAEPRVQALRARRRELETAMGRPDYDPIAVRTALARVRAEETALRADLDRTLLEFATRLEPEERVALSPLFRKSGRGWRERPNEGLSRSGGLGDAGAKPRDR
ncbi:MAG: periplasmic heavy metal sensor [Proteobacteria bacterium]|nr:periplasmic heavy metal sensor [Pseudomonadota bacterium]